MTAVQSGEAAAASQSEQDQQRKSADAGTDFWSVGQPHVLIVDDDPGVCELLQQMLRKAPYRITAVGDGQSALGVLKREAVQLLLTDYKLPDTDGVTIIERTLRESPQTGAIIMTGFASVDLAVKAMKAGAADFLTKPFVPDLVLLTVKRVLEMQHLRRENAVLKHAAVQSGRVRVQAVQLADTAQRAVVRKDVRLDEQMRLLAERERQAAERDRERRDRDHALFAAVTQQLQEAVRSVQASAGDQVTALAFAIASKVVREEAGRHREAILSQVRAALDHVHGSPAVRIRVHPQDMPTLEQAKPSLSQAAESPLTVRIDGDPAVTPGGCVVETASRFVDATLEAQLIRLGEALKKRGSGAIQ